MQIKLLYHTPEHILDLAASVPYQTENKEKLGSAVFEVKNVSQSLLAQLSRHPHLNLTVQSSRYCDHSTPRWANWWTSLHKIWNK